jgi:capsular polysaccharide biosynthesis protein
MLQSYSAQEAYFEAGGQTLGLGHYLEILKRRALYFALPFIAILLLGAFVTSIQRPIYQAKGKVLVESQGVPADLVRPTVTETANQRIQVIQQRIMTRDNLLALINKYGMFPGERQWMSGTELLDLMRERTTFELVDIAATSGRPNASTIAFTLSFDYENPDTTLRVTNDLLTLILSEDARDRTDRAAETTKFLSRESQRLQGQLAAILAQIAENQAHPRPVPTDVVDPAKMQATELAKLKADLAEKSSTYASGHPAVIALKKKIAAMEQVVANTPAVPPAQAEANTGLFELTRQQLETSKALEDTNKKLEEAQLGERLERDQKSERLQVIEQPMLPSHPIKPNRFKLFGLTFALALVGGIGCIFAAESLDRSIRESRELFGVANGRSVVSLPYIATRSEASRKKGRLGVLLAIVAILLIAGLTWFVLFGPPIDLPWIKHYWLDHLTRLSK